MKVVWKGSISFGLVNIPVRLYAAPMYGYKSLKWLGGIELTDTVVPGYWEVRGYDVDAWVGHSNGRADAPV